MKIQAKTKTFVTFAVILAAVLGALVAAVVAAPRGNASADVKVNVGSTYYYDELRNSVLAQKFYDVFDRMNKNGDFKDGKKGYDLSSVLSQSELYDYLEKKSPRIPVALGAARDAYYLDHPDLFYVDIYKLGLSVSTAADGKFVAYLDRGRAENYYCHPDVTSAAQIDAQIEAYNAALNAVVDKVNKSASSDVDKVYAANAEIARLASYDYGALKDSQSSDRYNTYVNTAYGALVDGKALCGGYAVAFKAVMDKLDIPCVLISGAVNSGRDTVDQATGEVLLSGYASHMWNAVEIGGHWYVVDVTWNDTGSKTDKYVLLGESSVIATHIPDGVISSSGFELIYPAIRPLDYGQNTDGSGFEYKDSGKVGDISFGYGDVADEVKFSMTIGASYQGKNFVELADEGLYFAYRNKTNEVWSDWWCTISVAEVYSQGDKAYYDTFVAALCAGKYTITNGGYNTQQLQFAIFDKKPAAGEFAYTAEDTASHIVATGVPYSNKAYLKDMPAPYVKKLSPNEKGYISDQAARTVTIEYGETLMLVDDGAPVGIEVKGTHADVGKYIKVENVTWDGDSAVSFTFTPSKQYSHDCEAYRFTPTNLVGINSGKAPDAATLSYRLQQVVCPKVFNDGRLYMKVFGEPSFVSASDESLSGFKDNTGKPIAGGDTRAQLMLVVNAPSDAESADMKAAAQTKLGLAETDIKASSTYQIDLHVCGFLQSVPSGSYMQVGFGFPEPYGPDDAGVTFTVYHYTRNADGTINTVDAVPCVVTEYGIIATVKSFSPFMICAVDANSAAAQTAAKNIVAYADGEGGSVDNNTVRTVESGSVTYTVTKKAGYSVDSVTLNGADVKSKLAADGKLTLDYAELAKNNTMVVTFIADSVVAADAASGLTRVRQPNLIVEQKDMIVAYAPTSGTPAKKPAKTNVGLIVGIVVPIVVVVLAAVGVAVFFVLRKRKAAATATAAPAKDAQRVNAEKPAQKPAPTQTQQGRPAQPTRPTSTQQGRPAQPTRPTSTQQGRPAQPTRPTATQQGRPAQPTRPTSTQQGRPVQPTRPASSSRPTDKNKK